MDYPKVSQNKKWDAELFDHQLTAIHMLEDREENNFRIIANENETVTINTNIGVYADPVGYGKTLAVAGLLSRDKMEWDVSTHYKHHEIIESNSCGINLCITKIKNYKKINTSLLVVNQSIIEQWKDELKLLRVKFKVINTKKLVDDTDVTQHSLVIVIPTMYNRLVEKYYNVYFKRFIFDEPVNTKLPAMRSIKAGFNWFITATPRQLLYQNGSRYHFLRSIFSYWTSEYMLNNLIVKNDLEYVKRSYVIPTTHHQSYNCYQPLYHMCRNYTDETTLDMISAGNVLGAIRRLGGDETSNIIELIKGKINNKISYNDLNLQRARLSNNEELIEKYKKIDESLKKQFGEISEKFEERLNGECSICLESIKKPILVPCCQNIMCGECILNWRKEKSSCPLCRTEIETKSLVYIKTKQESPSRSNRFNRKLTKPETIFEIIKNKKGGKFIIFSNYSETFSHIVNVLDKNHISYKELKGQIGTRNKILKSFKNGEISVLFLNSKNNGAGINLQQTTDIILYHRLEHSLEIQTIGRANRVGRRESLTVHHLL